MGYLCIPKKKTRRKRLYNAAFVMICNLNFKPFTIRTLLVKSIFSLSSSKTFSGSDDEGPSNGVVSHNSSSSDDQKRKDASSSSNSTNVTCYRFGSVGQVRNQRQKSFQKYFFLFKCVSDMSISLTITVTLRLNPVLVL